MLINFWLEKWMFGLIFILDHNIFGTEFTAGLCVCMYVFILYVCIMHVCMYVCMHVCMYVCMHACMYVLCMYVLCMYVCMHVCIMYVCVYLL